MPCPVDCGIHRAVILALSSPNSCKDTRAIISANRRQFNLVIMTSEPPLGYHVVVIRNPILSKAGDLLVLYVRKHSEESGARWQACRVEMQADIQSRLFLVSLFMHVRRAVQSSQRWS